MLAFSFNQPLQLTAIRTVFTFYHEYSIFI